MLILVFLIITKETISFECKFKKGSIQSIVYEPVSIKGFFKRSNNSSNINYIITFFRNSLNEFT